MNKQQSMGWSILTKEEQLAITLSSVHNKSTWEAGEIMGKAHYKYLEIHARGVKFFRMFTDYFTLFDEIFPKELSSNKNFQRYIALLVLSRKPMKDVLAEIKDEEWQSSKSRNHILENCMKALKYENKGPQAEHLYHLIKDFDRWNNFRILPLSLQDPSAFKRRNKHRIKKILKLNSSLHPLALQRVIKLYEMKNKRGVHNSAVLYLPIISVYAREMSAVIKVMESHIDDISRIPIFVFREKADADKYLEITSAYLFKENHSCRDGQIFWPELRYTIKKAVNHDSVMGVNPTRKAFLDNAGIDPEIRKFLKKREAEQNDFLAQHLTKKVKKAREKKI